MIIYKCDTCHKETGEYGLNTLRNELRTIEVKDVCNSCLEKISEIGISLQLKFNEIILEKKKELIKIMRSLK